SHSHQLALSSPQDEVLHGRYNTIITTTNHLPSNSNDNNRWIGSFDPSLTRRSNSTSSQAISLHPINNNSSPPPIEAIHAIEATYRWATNFVRGLNLCPWAGASIDNPGAICYWVLLIDDDRQEEQVDVLDKMEEIIREAGVQLTLATTATTNSDDDHRIAIDPSVAISFIMLVPKTAAAAAAGKETTNFYLPSFENFHEFFIDLEDRLLDECDDYWDSIDNDDDDETGEHFQSNSTLGCDITVAAFHPEWQFNGGSEDGESDDNDDNSNIIVHPIDYEKRTPYPTISIVMSSVIDSLMKEREGDNNNNDDSDSSSSAPVTERIADLNEKTLCAIGVERLKEIFDKDVLECPGRDSHLS
ncbi:hypothetical protein ACHAWC_002784, partial [Mediolabrus comicus]